MPLDHVVDVEKKLLVLGENAWPPSIEFLPLALVLNDVGGFAR